jgi:hypothetical protein
MSDTSTPNGRLVFGIFATIAEFERELIRERVRSGLAAARARGKQLGRPPRTIDTERIAAPRKQGLSWRLIAMELEVGVGTVHRMAQDSKAPTEATVSGAMATLASRVLIRHRYFCYSAWAGTKICSTPNPPRREVDSRRDQLQGMFVGRRVEAPRFRKIIRSAFIFFGFLLRVGRGCFCLPQYQVSEFMCNSSS